MKNQTPLRLVFHYIVLLTFWVNLVSLSSFSNLSAETPVGPYAVATAAWNIHNRGSHRAVVTVNQSADAVRATLHWRRRDTDPQNKNIVVIDDASGNVINNRIVSNLTRESGIVAFQPVTVPGNYSIYYLPHSDSQNTGSYSGGYVSFQNTASSSWLNDNNLPTGVEALPEATFLRFEARLPIDSFWPMEVPMTAAEKSSLLTAHTAPFLIFPEDARHPVKMRDELPQRWLADGPSSTFDGIAQADESFAFQIALYASTQSVNAVQITFPDLVPTSGAPSIPATAFSCINLGGTNWDGAPLVKVVNVSQGSVQPFWITLQVPVGITSGDYTGTITVSSANAPDQTINMTLTVDADSTAIVNHGFNTPENHSRLSWLNSQFGVSDIPITPYTPMTVDADTRTIEVLGRTLTFGNTGLPDAITVGTTDVLSDPSSISITQGGSPLDFSGATPSLTLMNDGAVEWESTGTSGGISMHTRARMEFDGHINFKVGLTSASNITLDNVTLEIPLTAAASQMMAGMGKDGGLRPASFSWSWSGPWDSLWLGGAHAGLHCELRGGTYHGPLLDLYKSAAPPTWGGGSVTVQNNGTAGEGALLRATTESQSLDAGVETVFEFSLLITPVKPVDTSKHFATRYYHNAPTPAPPSDWKDWGVNIINVHHSSTPNPFINWPFATPVATTSFIETYHAQGAKVKLYNTVRELTQYTAEIWALRSLNNEILATGGGGGFPWLREHFINDYSLAWYMPVTEGRYDASTVTTRDSRWYNYYVEGIRWLAENYHFDGLYLDDVAFDRRTVKRIRRALLDSRPDSRIDLHSNTGFSKGAINQYADFLPYLDRLWFGESVNYDALSADEWLAQVSGIPFGLMGELLHAGGNPWLGTVFGMTQRWGWTTDNVFLDPRPVWKIWDEFGGLADAQMIGWWDDSPPVTTSDPEVKVTSYVKNGKTLIALGNFSSSPKDVTLTVDWSTLGLDPTQAVFFAPASSGFQGQAIYQPSDTISVNAKRGLLIIISESGGDLIPPPHLLAHYRLSEGSGAIAIDSTGHYDGSYINAVSHGNDAPPAAESSLGSVTLSGGEWVELPTALADTAFRSNQPWTISFWVRPTLPSNSHNATFTWMNPSGEAKGILFYLEENGSLDYWIGDGTEWNGWPNYDPAPDTDLQDAWIHVAASFDGGEILRCYYNGTLAITSNITSFQMPDAGQPITLGLRPSSPGLNLHGSLSDVRIYQGMLSNQDIQDLHTYPGWTVPVDVGSFEGATNPYHTLSLSLSGAGMPDGEISLSIPSVASWSYQFQYSDDLQSWSPLGASVTSPPAGRLINVTAPPPHPPNRFYRAVITK